ncbi:uncharacterized protein N7515_006474 [Penicillium bovifimosum]|uniref:Uncharacterized protein n=1 Tax=Penicillium bovifimosum TaxID=126998 RepID=A0A9W9GUQ4_9EURO|nr:uncharacterized protein N7515_006474 [Penicillium bovifimosum]KAJ5130435.1 hypothetical protein N7515_006474 [Penicillium bovifimosum]
MGHFCLKLIQSLNVTPVVVRRVLQTHPTPVAADFDITLDPGASGAETLLSNTFPPSSEESVWIP